MKTSFPTLERNYIPFSTKTQERSHPLSFLERLRLAVREDPSSSTINETLIRSLYKDFYGVDFSSKTFIQDLLIHLKNQIPLYKHPTLAERFDRSQENHTLLIFDLLLYANHLRLANHQSLADIVCNAAEACFLQNALNLLDFESGSEEIIDEIHTMDRNRKKFIRMQDLLSRTSYEELLICEGSLSAIFASYPKNRPETAHPVALGLLEKLLNLLEKKELPTNESIIACNNHQNPPFLLWIYTSNEDIRITAIPNTQPETEHTVLQGMTASSIRHNSLSMDKFSIAPCRIERFCDETNRLINIKGKLQKSISENKRMWGISKVQQFFSKTPKMRLEEDSLYIQTSQGYFTLKETLQDSPFFLSADTLLQICRTLNQAGKALVENEFAYSFSRSSILCKKTDDKLSIVLDPLDVRDHKDLSEDAFPKKCVEKAMAQMPMEFLKAFLDLDEEEINSSFSLENLLLQKWSSLLEVGNPICYQKILEFRDRHRGFDQACMKELLNYAKMQKEEGNIFAATSLESFVYTLAFFSPLTHFFQNSSSLNQLSFAIHDNTALLLNEKQQQKILDETPSFQDIERALSESETLLTALQSPSQPQKTTKMEKISYEDLIEVIDESLQMQEEEIRSLQNIINSLLEQSPSVGFCKRFDKGSIFKENLVPRSFWITVFEDHLEVVFFQEEMPNGHLGKYTLGSVTTLSNQFLIPSIPVTIFEVGKGLSLESAAKKITLHKKLLLQPESERFLFPAPQLYPPHQKAYDCKQEGVLLHPQTTLQTEEILDEVLSEVRPITPLEKLLALEETARGLKFLQTHNISHGNMQRRSIATFKNPSGEICAKFHDLHAACSFLTRQESNIHQSYWDSIRRHTGFITKETDVYGLTIVIAETLFPLWGSEIRQALLKGTYFSFSEKKNLELKEEYEKTIKTIFTRGFLPNIDDLMEDSSLLEILVRKCEENDPLYLKARETILTFLLWSYMDPLFKRVAGSEQVCKKEIDPYTTKDNPLVVSNKEMRDIIRSTLTKALFPSATMIQELLEACRGDVGRLF